MAPAQPNADEGVTEIVVTSGVAPVFMVVYADMLPVVGPVGIPVPARLLIHEKVLPLIDPMKFTGVVLAPLQMLCAGTDATVGAGLTVNVNVAGIPAHPLADGVTTMLLYIGIKVVLAAVNELIVVVPDAPKPIAVLLFVHANVATPTLLVNVSAVVAVPTHIDWAPGDTEVTVGVGLTVYENCCGVPIQPLAIGVATTVAIT